MKKDFESMFMPNVMFFIPDNLQDSWDKLCLKIWPDYDFAVFTQFVAIDETGNSIFFRTNSYSEWLKFSLPCVSIYEAIPELVPDGMRYNKELDKLVPDVIEIPSIDEAIKVGILSKSISIDECTKKSIIKDKNIAIDEYFVGIDLKNHRAYNVGSSNYASMNIQPWDVWKDWKLDPWDADIIKRISRTKQISGKTFEEARIEDYEKIKHICDEKISQLKEVKKC